VDGAGPLKIESAVIFRQHIFAVWLLTHLYPSERIAALLDIRDLVGGVLRRSIQQGHRQHGREIVG
jgi:hypothetical protein